MNYFEARAVFFRSGLVAFAFAVVAAAAGVAAEAAVEDVVVAAAAAVVVAAAVVEVRLASTHEQQMIAPGFQILMTNNYPFYLLP